MNAIPDAAGVKPKARYHHGDLKEALVQAAYTLIARDGADNFLLSDACRLAGVSTAAPYKHFRDRDELLEIVVSRAFDVFSERSTEAIKAKGEATLEGIIAMGEAYVAFAVEQQHLFRLMFGRRSRPQDAEQCNEEGAKCFHGVIDQVTKYCIAHDVGGDPRAIAIRLWTFVHGAASLLIDEDYAVVAPELDVMAMIRDTTPLILARR